MTEPAQFTDIDGLEEFMRDGDDPIIKEHRMDCPRCRA
jgi:hypothetical protein